MVVNKSAIVAPSFSSEIYLSEIIRSNIIAIRKAKLMPIQSLLHRFPCFSFHYVTCGLNNLNESMLVDIVIKGDVLFFDDFSTQFHGRG